MSRNSFIQQLENLCNEYANKLEQLDERETRVLSSCYTLLGTYHETNSRNLEFISDFARAMSNVIVEKHNNK